MAALVGSRHGSRYIGPDPSRAGRRGAASAAPAGLPALAACGAKPVLTSWLEVAHGANANVSMTDWATPYQSFLSP